MSTGPVVDTTSPLLPTYPPQQVTFVTGRGTELFDDAGHRYLDFLCGLAVTSLGHAHPEVAQAIAQQAGQLVHTSNLFGTEPGREVAATLDRLIGGGGQVFFCNSGAEANEAAIKLARKWAGPDRYVVLSAEGSFHGRTLATLHATGQPGKHGPFQPLPIGFRHVAWNDLPALEAAVTGDVAAVLLEPIQGEGGVRPATIDYLQGVEALCRKRNILFMVDEVQTGLARTGEWFAFQHYGVSPDVVCLAKALGNGMPIGAIWAKSEVGAAFQPGDHASTFGGQPLATSAARAVLQVMERDDAPGAAAAAGSYLRAGLEALPGIASVRGTGLLLAAELSEASGPEVAGRALHAGLVINGVTPTALRFAPPLFVSSDEIDEAIGILRGV
ncbi:MAG: acetylornithine/succinylornithine family transaminase, partial [Acidimicrobiia bacterium]|nr:acetylornithine/succinylornithine family transaminase [Acidimicrobiia bacterium]